MEILRSQPDLPSQHLWGGTPESAFSVKLLGVLVHFKNSHLCWDPSGRTEDTQGRIFTSDLLMAHACAKEDTASD